jgi:hypothetical protein
MHAHINKEEKKKKEISHHKVAEEVQGHRPDVLLRHTSRAVLWFNCVCNDAIRLIEYMDASQATGI